MAREFDDVERVPRAGVARRRHRRAARRRRRDVGRADDAARGEGPRVPVGVPRRHGGRRLPAPALARRARRARGGAAARVRRHHPGPRAAVPHQRMVPDAVRRRRSTTRRAGSSTRSPTSSCSTPRAHGRRAAVQRGTSFGSGGWTSPVHRNRDEIVERACSRAARRRSGAEALGLRVGRRRRPRQVGRGRDPRHRRRRATRPRRPSASPTSGRSGSCSAGRLWRRSDHARWRRWRSTHSTAPRSSLRRNQTLGTIMERLAKVNGAAPPRRGGRRRPAPDVRAGVEAGEPLGRRHRKRGSSPATASSSRRRTATRCCCCASPRRGPARIPVPVNPQMRPDEIAPRHRRLVAAARDPHAPRRSTAPSRSPSADASRTRRRRRALLHVGHDRQAQGRRAHPPLAGRSGRRRRRDADERRSCAARPCCRCRSRTSWASSPILGLACAGIPVYFMPQVPSRRRARRHRATPRVDLHRRPCDVPHAARSRRREPRPVVGADLGLGRRRDAGRARRQVQATGRDREPADRRSGRRGAVLRGLRHGRDRWWRRGQGVAADAQPRARRVARFPAAGLQVPGRRRGRRRRRHRARSASCCCGARA